MLRFTSKKQPRVRAPSSGAKNFLASELEEMTHDYFEGSKHFAKEAFSNESLRRVRENFFKYRIFPPHLMRAEISGTNTAGELQVNSRISQSIFIGPMVWEAEVVVVECARDAENETQLGFAYETLEGHPEAGQSKFTLNIDPTGQTIKFSIESRSRPAHPLTKILRPVGRFIQKKYSWAAVSYFLDQIDSKLTHAKGSRR